MPDPITDLHLDDSIDINLRPVDDVTRCAIVLVTLARRGAIETLASEIDTDEELYAIDTDRFDLYSWARRELSTQLNDNEMQVLRTQVGSLASDLFDHCTEALIAAETLCWSFGLIDRLSEPSFPSQSHVERMFGWAPEPWADIDSLRIAREMRDEVLIAQERERRELWSWRLSLDEADVKSPDQMREVIQDTSEEAHAASLIESVDQDFSLGGQPVSSLSEHQRSDAEAVAGAQLLALNWVCGLGESWDATPVFRE